MKNSFLSQPNDIVFSWGKDIEDSINIKDNFIEKLVNIYPSYLKYSKNSKSEYKKFLINIKKKKKIITFFDSNMYETGWINPKDYNIILKILLSKINNSNNLFLVLKLKYSDHSKYINSENLKLINKLAKNNNLILIKKKYQNNSTLINFSDLIISINSLTIAAEAIINKTDNICYCNDAVNKMLINKLNSIQPTAYMNLDQFKNKLALKLQFKRNNKKLTLLHDYFFEKNKKRHEIDKYIFDLLRSK